MFLLAERRRPTCATRLTVEGSPTMGGRGAGQAGPDMFNDEKLHDLAFRGGSGAVNRTAMTALFSRSSVKMYPDRRGLHVYRPRAIY